MMNVPQAKPVKYDAVDEVAAKADTPMAYLPQLDRVKPTVTERPARDES